MTFTSRLSSNGQVEIPSEIRKSLGLATGDLVSYEIRDREVVLKRAEPFDVVFHKELAATLDEWASPEDEEAFRDL